MGGVWCLCVWVSWDLVGWVGIVDERGVVCFGVGDLLF